MSRGLLTALLIATLVALAASSAGAVALRRIDVIQALRWLRPPAMMVWFAGRYA